MSARPSSLRRVSPPPRTLPPTLGARLLLGGFLNQFGWCFVAFGMVFVWIFDAGAGIVEWLRFQGDVATAEGVVTGSRRTSFSINEVPVYETSYEFSLPHDGSVHGRSYATGAWLNEGQSVTVEYLDGYARAGDRPVSRIRGMRASRAGTLVTFIFLFPIIGFGMAAFGLRRGIRARRLLTIGEVTRGILVRTEATNVKINNRPVMRLVFEFEAPRGGTYEVEARTHEPERLQDEERELLVFDAREPEEAVMLDELPCQPRVGPGGQFEASSAGVPAALYLLLPGLSTMTLLRYLASLL